MEILVPDGRSLFQLSLHEAVQRRDLFEPLVDAAKHAEALNQGFMTLRRCNEGDIPRLVALIDLLNVEHPELIGTNHLQQTLTQCKAMLESPRIKHKYVNYTPSLHAIISDLDSKGPLAQYVERVQKVRNTAGVATPIPLFEVIPRVLAVLKGAPIPFAQWDAQTIQEVADYIRANPDTDFINPLFIYTTSGYNRGYDCSLEDTIAPIAKIVPKRAAYIEPAASVGVTAAERRRQGDFEAMWVFASDLISAESAQGIQSLTDYYPPPGRQVPYDSQARAVTRAALDIQAWEHNILQQTVAEVIMQKAGKTLQELVPRRSCTIIGLHNILVHLNDKDKVVRNATHGIIQKSDYIWVSGGWCANLPVLSSMLFQRTEQGMDTKYIQGLINRYPVQVDPYDKGSIADHILAFKAS
jgi:hypothetical protein